MIYMVYEGDAEVGNAGDSDTLTELCNELSDVSKASGGAAAGAGSGDAGCDVHLLYLYVPH